MAKLTAGGTDVGLIYEDSLTANGSTPWRVLPAKRLINVGINAPNASTCKLQCTYDAGATVYSVAPTTLSVVDATAAAAALSTNLYDEEENVQYRMTVTNYAAGTATVRFSSAKLD